MNREAPEFCMVTGYAQVPNPAGQQMASGMIYIGEYHSGKVKLNARSPAGRG